MFSVKEGPLIQLPLFGNLPFDVVVLAKDLVFELDLLLKIAFNLLKTLS
jgi:hypothetical protein